MSGNPESVLPGTRSAEVLEAIRRRAASSPSSWASDGCRLALVVEGGGMRGAYSAGSAVALELMGFSRVFDAVYGTSAGALNGSYLLAGQGSYGCHIYYEDVTGSRFINPLRIHKMVDIDYLFDEVIGNRRKLDTARVLQARSEFYIAAADRITGRSILFDAKTSGFPLTSILKASSALPVLYNRPVRLGPYECFDGGTLSPYPLIEAIDAGYTHILALLTRPREFRRTGPGALARWIVNAMSSKGSAAFTEAFSRAFEDANRRHAIATGAVPPPRPLAIAAICPSAQEAAMVSKFSTRAADVKQAVTAMAARVLRAFGKSDGEIAGWMPVFD